MKRMSDNIDYNELLGRNPINTDLNKIKSFIQNKAILVTGGAGSIGSEIVRQLCDLNTSLIIIYDNSETPLFYLKKEINETHPNVNIKYFIGDIRDKLRLDEVFENIKPDIVFHAAAYKHVPIMENNINEAIKTNIIGTINVSHLSIKHNVKKFIMISTDKAVNPINVMGITKRIAEIYTQYLNKKYNTSFIITRFGNVLGSQGSVIPIFVEQIKKGGPITITHPDVNRYFMTIPEASQLVLCSSYMGNGGETFLFKMGDPVKILDLANRLISKLSNNTININFVGLRPGEKISEELFFNTENNIATEDPNILMFNSSELDFDKIIPKIKNLIKLKNKKLDKTVMLLEEIINGFKN